MSTRARSGWMSVVAGVCVALTSACGGSQTPPTSPQAGTGPVTSSSSASSSASAASGQAAAAGGRMQGSQLTDGSPVAFRKQFDQADLGIAWNLFGVAVGKREVRPGPDGLYLRVTAGEKAWDAVGARTSRVRAQGDFDLRGRFRSFSSGGNGAAKLIVVDAASPRGEAAYVERIQIDGKNLFKFGGEVGENLEDWGFVPTDSSSADLRLVRKSGKVQGFYRTGDRGPWKEIAPPQPVPSSMPNTVKFGVKLSADLQKSAQVTWTELTMDSQLIHAE